MKKTLLIALTSILALSSNYLAAQDAHMCGNEVIQQKINNDPYLKASFEDYYKKYDAENKAMAEHSARSQSKTTASYHKILIPVVFHVVLNQAQFTQFGDTAGLIERLN